MNEGRFPLITPAMLVALMMVVLSGTATLDLTGLVISSAGNSGYWSVLMAASLAVLFVVLGGALQKRFPQQALFAIAQESLGRPLSFVGNLAFVIAFLSWSLLAARDAGDLAHAHLLDRTPLWFVTLQFFILVAYLAINGFPAVVRVGAFVFIPAIFLRLAWTFLGYQTLSLTNLRPVFGAQPGDYALGALLFAPAYLGLAGALVIHPHLTLPHRWRKSMLGVVALASLLYLVTAIGVIGVFGVEFSLLYTWPNQAVVQRIAMPFALLEQGDCSSSSSG